MRAWAWAGWGVALALWAAPGRPLADDLTLSLEPSYAISTVEVRDQLGATTRQDSGSFGQTYRLNFDRPIGPALQASVGALLQDRSTRLELDGRRDAIEATDRGAWARLALVLPALSAGLSYELGDRSATRTPLFGREDLAAHATWRPAGLPELSLRLSRTHHYDDARTTQDQVTSGATASARYREGPLEATYLLLWSQPSDAISGTSSRSVDQVAKASYSGRFMEDRVVAYASASARNQVTTTLSAGSGALSVPRPPLAGLSLIEAFPAQPESDTLLTNTALVDGNVAAGAGLDIGSGPGVTGDQNRRDLGVQLADLVTAVNQVQVWVDKRLPPGVAAAYGWTAWQSDDNRSWVPVPITGPVAFDPFQPFFEIPILATRARYLKVVTQPLRPGVTTDPALVSVQVTELRLFQVTPAAQLQRVQATSAATVTATATTLLWRPANLSWDLAATLERRVSPDVTTYTLLNSLVASQPLGHQLQLSGRLARLDGDFGTGHGGQTDWGAGLIWKPVPALLSSLVYSGQFADARPTLDATSGRYRSREGNLVHSFASLVRADLYPGVSAQLQGSTSLVREPSGKGTWNNLFSATSTLIPNPWVTFNLGWLSSLTTVSPADGPSYNLGSARLDAGATFQPSSVISLSGTLTWWLVSTAPTLSGTAQLSYAPLRGELQLSLAGSSAWDTASQTKTVLLGPSLRWNVRPGVQLTASYTSLETSTRVLQTRSRTAGIGLSILL